MSAAAGYSGTPLPKKLGIRPEHLVLVDGAPPEFSLGQLPDGARLHRRTGREPYDVILTFCPDEARMRRRWPVLHPATTDAGSIWVAWPKRSSGVPTDMTEDVIRDFALVNGRVDVKVAAIDETWSGLKLVVRLADRPATRR